MEFVVGICVIGDGEVVIGAFTAGEFKSVGAVADIDDFGIAFAGTGPVGDSWVGAEFVVYNCIVWTIVAGAVDFEWFGDG